MFVTEQEEVKQRSVVTLEQNGESVAVLINGIEVIVFREKQIEVCEIYANIGLKLVLTSGGQCFPEITSYGDGPSFSQGIDGQLYDPSGPNPGRKALKKRAHKKGKKT